MKLRSPNKDWPKIMQSVYYHTFLRDYRSGRFCITNDMFSNPRVLDCLEGEIVSAQNQATLARKFFGKMPIHSILVVGSGSGRLGTQIQLVFPHAHLFEIDKNAVAVKRLQRKYGKNARRTSIEADACIMPFADGSMDVVICYCVFRYIRDSISTLREIMRVTKNNGMIMISEAKYKSTFESVQAQLIREHIVGKTTVIPTIKLPHLSFFYFLVQQYGIDVPITRTINEVMKNNHMDSVHAAYQLASYSLGSVYTVHWRKNV
jgi:ubiquinone/menaquinone biosynthesis C-methylase UbiE